MRRILLIIAVIVGVLVAWLVFGRYLVLLADSFTTEGEAVATSGPFLHTPGSLSVMNTPGHPADVPLVLTGPDGSAAALRFDVDAMGRVTVQIGDEVFPLGQRGYESETGPADGLYFAFTPDPGDMVTLRTAHSVLAWPTPFDLNFMTGKSPSWRRNTYYTLSWRKPDGATLTMTWRYEQWFYDDWASPMMISPGRTGLIRADIDGG